MARASALTPVLLVIPITSSAMAVAPAAATAQVDLLLHQKKFLRSADRVHWDV